MISSRKSLLKFLLALVVTVAMSACSSKRGSSSQATGPAGSLIELTPQGYMNAMISSYSPQWTRVKMPLTVNLLSPTSVSASGQLIMERGKSVTISMRVLGMEVASLMLTADTVTVLDRWNKRYLREGLGRFLAGFDVDINNVQDILMGRLFIPGKAELTAKQAESFRFDAGEGGSWGCTVDESGRKYDFAFVAVATTLSTLYAQTASGSAEIAYEQFQPTNYGPVASEMHLTAKKVNVSIKLRPDKATWNGDVNPPSLRVPPGYTPIDASSILKKLSVPN